MEPTTPRHRDRPHAGDQQRADPFARPVLVERDDDLAVAVEPLDDLEGVALGEQVVVLVLLEHVLELVRRAPEVAALDIHDEDRVAVPLRGQEADVGHLAGHQCVQRRRRPVGDVMRLGEHLLDGTAELLGEQLEHVEHPARVVRGRRRGLGRDHRPRLVVEHRIGERAAHVDADHVGHGHSPR
jgi:hypothetical protein